MVSLRCPVEASRHVCHTRGRQLCGPQSRDQRARILRAEADYDAEIIEARDLQRVRGAAEAHIQELEAERLMQGRAGVLSPVLGVDGPGQEFLIASLDLRRQIVDARAVVTLLPQPRGRKGFRPESVVFDWR